MSDGSDLGASETFATVGYISGAPRPQLAGFLTPIFSTRTSNDCLWAQRIGEDGNILRFDALAARANDRVRVSTFWKTREVRQPALFGYGNSRGAHILAERDEVAAFAREDYDALERQPHLRCTIASFLGDKALLKRAERGLEDWRGQAEPTKKKPTPKAEGADRWHYPRSAFAQQQWKALSSGAGASALILFGPHRTGKTTFLRNDLAPLAEADGYRAVYVSFWGGESRAATMLVSELADAARGVPLRSRPPLREGSDEGHGMLSMQLPLGVDVFVRIDELVDKLSRRRGVLLLLDDLQELSSGSRLIATIRTSLDKRKGKVLAVLAGTSKDRFTGMVVRRSGALHQFGSAIELPPLGDDFVDHQLSVLETNVRQKVDREDARDAFQRLHRSPFLFSKLMMNIALNPNKSLRAATRHVREEMAEQMGFAETWLRLAPLARVTLAYVAVMSDAPHSAEGRRAIRAILNETPPTNAQIDAAVRRLVRLGLVRKLRYASTYEFEDPELREWVAARPEFAGKFG